MKPWKLPKEDDKSYPLVAGMYASNIIFYFIAYGEGLNNLDPCEDKDFNKLMRLLRKNNTNVYSMFMVFYYLVNPDLFEKHVYHLDPIIMNKYYMLC